MSRYARGLFAAMEEQDEKVAATHDEADEVELIEEGSTIDRELASVEKSLEALDSAEDDIETLEDIQGVMEDSVENGEGLNETAAEIAEIAVESIYRRLGVRKGRSMPSLESFGSRNTRLHATKIAMESVGETVEKAKKFFMELLEKIRQGFEAFWKKITSWFDKSRDKVDSYSEKINDVKYQGRDTYPEDEVFKDSEEKVTVPKAISYLDHAEKVTTSRKKVKKASSDAKNDIIILCNKEDEITQDSINKIIEKHLPAIDEYYEIIYSEKEKFDKGMMDEKESILEPYQQFLLEHQPINYLVKIDSSKESPISWDKASAHLLKEKMGSFIDQVMADKLNGTSKEDQKAIAKIPNDKEGSKIAAKAITDIYRFEVTLDNKYAQYIKHLTNMSCSTLDDYIGFFHGLGNKSE
jgi:hypothetical protein